MLQSSVLGLNLMLTSPLPLFLMLFILGLIFGSFFNVIVQRAVDEKETWRRGRSYCDNCHQPLAWYDNIPLLSYLILKGRCRTCKKQISLIHPFTETATGLIFVFSGYLAINSVFFKPIPFLITFFLALFLNSVLWLILLFDCHYQIIPDELVLLILAAAIFKNGVLYVSGSFKVELFALEIILALLAIIFFILLRELPALFLKKKGLGWGDIKLVGPLMLLLGYPLSLPALFCAFIIGGVWGIILLVIGQKKFGQKIAFGPFLIISSWLTLTWGELLWQGYWQLF